MQHLNTESQIVCYRPCYFQQVVLQVKETKLFLSVHLLVLDLVFVVIFHL